jgi:hypothetical protein
MGLSLSFRVALGIGALLVSGAVQAQDSLDRDKTPAQLFASDCAMCHKSPQGLAKSGGLFGVKDFLREHYTASKESAAAIAAYLEQVNKAAGPAPREKPAGRAAPKGETGAKAAKKKEAGKPGEAKSEGKPSEAKSSESKPSDSKPAEAKPAEPKASDSKPSEAKPAETPKP